MSSAEKRAIQSFLDQAVDLDDVMNRTARLLAQLTKQVALVQYPSLGRSAVRHIELVQVAPAKILLIVITDTGRIEQRNVETGVDVDAVFMSELRQRLNASLVGQQLSDVPAKLSGIEQHFDMSVRQAVANVVTVLMESVLNQNEERIVIGGTSHLARLADETTGSMVSMLEALEEQMVLLKLFGETVLPDALQVRIGSENAVEEFQSSSVVTVGYGSGDQALATLGVLGPTRMDYSNSMSSVQAVAMYVGKILAD
jgi:heat-inducible transcriptional repressor